MPSLDDAIGSNTPDPLDSAIDGVTQSNKSALRESLYGAVRQNPDEAARATQLSRTTGVPAPVVSRNLKEVQQRAAIDDIDAAVADTTALARKMEESGFASLSHDDVGGLAEIERTLTRRSAGAIGGPAFTRQTELKAGKGPEAGFSSVISGLSKALPQGAELARQGIRAQFADAFGLEDMSADAILKGQRAQSDVALSTPQFESSTAKGVYSGGSSLMRQIPATVASVLLRSPMPSLFTAGVTTEAETYGKYRARGATPGQAFAGAAGEGAVEVGTEMLPMSFLVKKFGKTGAGEFLTGLLAREVPGEQIATLVQDAIDTAIANPDKTWGQYLAERPDAAYQTLVATLTQAGTMGAINEVGARMTGARTAEQAAQAQTQLAQLVAASKLRARDPQSFKEFIEAANENGPVQDVFIDTRTLQQAGVDLQALAQASPTVADQMDDALASGGDLVIPMAEYATHIAGTPLDSALTPHLRTSEEALSLDEAQRFYQTQAEEFKAAAAKVTEEKTNDTAWQQSAKAVETKLFGQLSNAGRFTDDVNKAYSTLLRDFYVATASRLGITPEEMFARYPIQVAAERVMGEQKMEQVAPQNPLTPNPAPEQSFLQQVVTAITAALGIKQEQPAVAVQPETDAKDAPVSPSAPLDLTEFFQDNNANPLSDMLAQIGEVDTINIEAPKMSEQEIDDAEAKFLSDAPAGSRYTRSTRLLKRVRAASEAIAHELDSQAERTREVDSALGPFTGYRVTADITAPDEFYSPGGSLKVKIYGKEQIEAGLMAEPALTFTVMPDGELSVNGPTLGGPTFREFEKRGWAEKAKAGDQETEGWTALTNPDGGNLPLQQVMLLLADVHARVRAWRGEDYVGLYWSRATGALGALGDYGTAVFFQSKKQGGNRGEISFGKDITQTPSVITLFENADLSTFLHEMGHFQLEVLANIAARPDAPADIAKDFDAALAWFGVPDLMTWQAMNLEERRPYHEQFARGFESYLFEGKAPSQELNGIFARFRAWLINVYKSVKALNVEISDDLSGVFDRMVATDEAIKAAETARGYAPLFKSAEDLGSTDAWAEYQRNSAEATQDALDGLQTRSLRDMRWLDNARGRLLKQMQADAKAQRKAVEDEVRAEVRAMPIYAAQRFIRYGELADIERSSEQRRIATEAGMGSTKLDLASLKEMYGEEPAAPWRYLPTGKNGLAGTDGMNPELVAQLFGFTSADHLVREILAAQPEATMIEGMTDQRVLERHGDISSPDTLARAVDEAIHNEARARFVATELKALSKAAGPVRAMTKAAKDFATAAIARKQIKAIKPNQHAAAETRAAKAAEKALLAGDTALAATEKRNQLIQNFSTRAAYDALTEVEKAMRYLKKFGNEGTRKSLDIDYRDQIDQLLERFDLRTAVPNNATAKRESLLAWVEAQRAQGFDPDIPPDLLTEAQRKPYKELTLEELRGLIDTIKQIEHLGRLKHTLLTAKDQREFEAVRDEIAVSIINNAKKSLPEQRASDRGFLVKMSSLFRQAAAIHRKFSSLARGFDGFKDGGPAWEYLVRNMNERGDFEASETEKATVTLTKLLLPVMDKAAGKLTQKEYFPSIDKSFSREERIGMLLNMGNEVNLERQLTGERLAPAQLQQIVGTLSKADVDFVNNVWEFIDSYWPLVAEKERRVSGKAPEKVEAVPFVLTLKGGEKVQMRGGYYPIAYDPLRSERSNADVNAEVAKQMQQGLYSRAQTRRGHTKARTESTGRALRYDFGEVISNHVTQVIHDLAWHEYLIDANRLLRSGIIENAVREHYGVEVLQEMKDTLRDIAVGTLGAEKGATFWNHLRYGTTIAGLGFNVFNTLQNLTGITQSMSRIGAKWVFKGAAHWAGDAMRFENSIKQVQEKSEFMRLRAKTMQREINDIRNKVSGEDSKLTAAYFYLQAKTQLIVDMPTWWGAYEKAMATDDMTEDKAVALADQAVIDAQGSGQIKDLAGIQRGGAGMKLFTTFYSFFNTTFNLTAEAAGRTDFRKPGQVALFTADMALLYSIPALLSTLLKAALMGDWDDEEKLIKKIIGDQISFALGTVVGLREAGAGVQAALGVGEGFGYTGPASVRFFADLYNLGKQINQGELDEAFWKALDNIGGVLFHYPSGQLNRTATGIVALIEGRTENPMAVVMGAPPKR